MCIRGTTRTTDKCCIQTLMEEEDTTMVGEANTAKADTINNATIINAMRTKLVPKSSVEGGVITPDQGTVETQSSGGTVENPVNTKRSAGRRSVSKADN